MAWAKWSIKQHNNTSIVVSLNHGHELVFIRLNGWGWLRDLWVRWPLRSYDGRSHAKLTHYDRDKGGHEAHDLEASRNFSFYHFTQGTAFLLL